MSALTSNCIVPFNLTKRNDLGTAYANITLMTSTGAKYIPQYVNTGSSIYFNQYNKLASIAWLTANELTFLKNGTFRIQFFINYTSTYGNIQITLYVNGIPLVGTYGTTSNLTFNGGQINGEFTVKLSANDKIQLINTSSGSFVISPTGNNNQVLASWTVTEIGSQ
jgi:hypothetical protein